MINLLLDGFGQFIEKKKKGLEFELKEGESGRRLRFIWLLLSIIELICGEILSAGWKSKSLFDI